MADKIQMPSLEPLSDEEWATLLGRSAAEYISMIDTSLKESNRFFVDVRFNKLLYFLATNEIAASQSRKTIHKGQIMYRARIYDGDDAEIRARDAVEGAFNGYDYENSFVPPIAQKVSDGRVNPSGIVYLYLAASVNGAVVEVSPKIGEWVSVAKVKFFEDTFVFDFGHDMISGFPICQDRSDWLMDFLSAMDDRFRKPHRKENDYLFCQYVSEFLKNYGYDGIRFITSKSLPVYADESFANYTIFNYSKCKPVSSDLRYIWDIKVEDKSYEEKELKTFHW